MLLYGASGHAKVIADSLLGAGFPVLGFFDDDPGKKELLGFPVYGKYDKNLFPDKELIVTIGYNLIRAKVSKSIFHPFGTSTSASSVVSRFAEIGAGTVALHNSVVQPGCQIGKHVIINTNASVDHDCMIADYAHISPNSTLCGNVSVGEGAQIGAGAVVLPGIKIGKWAVVGAGSVVNKNVPDYAVAVGCPIQVLKYLPQETFLY